MWTQKANWKLQLRAAEQTEMSRTLLAKDCHQEGGDLTFSSLGLNSRKEAKMAAKGFREESGA